MIPDFSDAIKYAVDKLVAEAVEEAVKKAKADLDRRIPEIVAGLSIQTMQRVQMRTMGDELCINVKLGRG